MLWVPGAVDGGRWASRKRRASRCPATRRRSRRAGRAAVEALPPMAYGGSIARGRGSSSRCPPGQVLRKKITLPAAVEENLGQALAYDLDRHTPFKPDEVYFDAVVIGRDPAKKEIRVDWAAALRRSWTRRAGRRRAGARRSSASCRRRRHGRRRHARRGRRSTCCRRRSGPTTRPGAGWEVWCRSC